MKPEQLQKFYNMAKPRSEEAIRKAQERKTKREDKQLLLQDLCARLLYGVIIHCKGEYNEYHKVEEIDVRDEVVRYFEGMHLHEESIINCFPYLRPMSTMTEEEARDIAILHGYNPFEILSTKVTDEYMDIILDNCDSCTITTTIWYNEIISSLECFDYLNKKMFDFRGLIPKDLALSTDEFNPYKN